MATSTPARVRRTSRKATSAHRFRGRRSPRTDQGHQIRRPPTRDAPGGEAHMELGPLGAGLAALGVIGPGIGIGILTGLAATAIGRNPDATPAIRAQFILGAAFAEGLGVLAIVVAILALVLK